MVFVIYMASIHQGTQQSAKQVKQKQTAIEPKIYMIIKKKTLQNLTSILTVSLNQSKLYLQ